jgi:hypothetical protein
VELTQTKGCVTRSFRHPKAPTQPQQPMHVAHSFIDSASHPGLSAQWIITNELSFCGIMKGCSALAQWANRRTADLRSCAADGWLRVQSSRFKGGRERTCEVGARLVEYRSLGASVLQLVALLDMCRVKRRLCIFGVCAGRGLASRHVSCLIRLHAPRHFLIDSYQDAFMHITLQRLVFSFVPVSVCVNDFGIGRLRHESKLVLILCVLHTQEAHRSQLRSSLSRIASFVCRFNLWLSLQCAF